MYEVEAAVGGGDGGSDGYPGLTQLSLMVERARKVRASVLWCSVS